MHSPGYFLGKNWRSDFCFCFVLKSDLGVIFCILSLLFVLALRLNVLSHLLLCQQIGQSYSVRISDKTVQHWNSCAISVEAWPHWCVSRVWWLPSYEMLTLPADEFNVMNSGDCLKLRENSWTLTLERQIIGCMSGMNVIGWTKETRDEALWGRH